MRKWFLLYLKHKSRKKHINPTSFACANHRIEKKSEVVGIVVGRDPRICRLIGVKIEAVVED